MTSKGQVKEQKCLAETRIQSSSSGGEWGVLQRRDQARFLQEEEEEVSVFRGSETWILVEFDYSRLLLSQMHRSSG
jgi:hypothetical protein